MIRNNINDPVVYIPPNSKININNKDLDPPITQYNTRVNTFDLEEVKKVVGGEYGRKARKCSK